LNGSRTTETCPLDATWRYGFVWRSGEESAIGLGLGLGLGKLRSVDAIARALGLEVRIPVEEKAGVERGKGNEWIVGSDINLG
jgi:hypothetical protein